MYKYDYRINSRIGIIIFEFNKTIESNNKIYYASRPFVNQFKSSESNKWTKTYYWQNIQFYGKTEPADT